MTIELGNYHIEEQIGEGGMAHVYRAVQKSLERPVALKILNPLHSNTPQFTQRFLNEGRIVAALNHSNIVTIHDIGVENGVHFIAMELLGGGDLKQRIRAGIPVDTALQYLETIAGALGAAHRKSIVHRDVKPANVLFRADGTLVLSDFGIAKRLGGDDLTITGSTIGSPHYLSPEQARGQPVDARADVYSLGVVLFEMLTRRKPYRGASDIDTVLMHVNEPLPRLPAEYATLQPLIDRMLAKKPDDRLPGADAVVAAVREARAAWRGDATELTPTTVIETGAEREWTRTVDLGFHEAQTTEQPAPETDADTAAGVDPAPANDTGAKRRAPLMGIGALVLVVLAVVAWLALRGGDRPDAAGARTSGDPASAVASAPAAAVPQPAASAAPSPTPPEALEPGPEPGPEPAAAVAAVPAAQADVSPAPLEPAVAAAPDTRVAELLRAADLAMEDFRLTLPEGNNALHYIEQALEIDPRSSAARAAFARIAERYAVLARSSIGKGDNDKARVFVARGLEVDPNNAELRALDTQLARTAPVATVDEPGGADDAPGKRIQGESPAALFNRVKRLFTD